MAKRFGARHISNGYAAMGNALRRPRISGIKGRDVKAAIEAEKRKAATQMRIGKSKK